MKVSLASILLALVLSLPPIVGGCATTAMPLAVTHVTVIDTTAGTRVPARPDTTVVIANGRIAAVGPSGTTQPPADAQVIDAGGKYLIPGLWDMHIHLTLVPDQSMTTDVIAPALLAYGITGVRDMGGDWQRIQGLRRSIADGRTIGPRIMSPGPFVDGPEPPASYFLSARDADEARQAVRKLKGEGVDFIKVQAQLTPESWRAALAEAGRLGIPVVGHIPERISAFEVARSSQRSVEHISAVLPGDAGILLACSRDQAKLRAEMLDIERSAAQPGADRKATRSREHKLQARMISTFDAGQCASLLGLLARNHVYAVPTQAFAQRILPLDPQDLPQDAALRLAPGSLRKQWEIRRKSAIEDSSAEDFALLRQIADQSRILVGAMHRAGVRLMAGTDAIDAYVVPGASLHRELQSMVESGLTPLEALQTATLNPAEFLGKADSLGAIEPGEIADLVLLAANPLTEIRNTERIDAVIQGGRLLNRTTLNELLMKVEAAAAAQ